MAQTFSIAHVTPYPWEHEHEVNTHVRCVCAELRQRGHRVVILAPSHSPTRVRESRRAIRAARDDPSQLLAAPVDVPGAGDTAQATPMLAIGEVIGARSGGPAPARRRGGAIAVDVARTTDELFASLALDFVHVHEPFAPSAGSAALRSSRSLNVATFHTPTEPLLSTQVARRFVEGFFGRLDARTANYEATAALMRRHFSGEYRVIAPGWDVERVLGAAATRPGMVGPNAQMRPVGVEDGARADALDTVAGDDGEDVRMLFVAHEERGALRVFMRALRRLAEEEPAERWSATVVTTRRAGGLEGGWERMRSTLRERLRFVALDEAEESTLLAGADLLVCASDGAAPAPGLLLRAMAHDVVGVASRIPIYEEVLGEGDRGLLFEPGDAETLAAQLARLLADRPLRERERQHARSYARGRTWARTADELERLYAAVAARRRTPARATLGRALAQRPLIDVDLHMHTNHSADCATPVEVLLATAHARGLGAIAVTDHNEISGALEARELAREAGVKVIVGEEVKTAGQGEVIGLFIEEKIERGMTLAETVREIKRQGGVVYVPHPFDRLHAVPDYEHLLPVLAEIDAIEVFNPRVAIDTFNEEALRFAAKYRIPAGAGSDSHVPQGLGSVRIRMHDFDGPQEFLASLRAADIVTRPTSLLYVQALKFLQTRATPAPARRARAARRVRRLARPAGR